MANPILDALVAARLQQLKQVGVPKDVGVSPQGTLFPNPGGLTNPAMNFMANRQTPQVNLGNIPIQKSFAPQAQPSLPQGATPPTFPEQPATKANGTVGMSSLMKFLAQMGIPLGAAVVGSAFPQFLPQAAGLSTGFATEQSKQREDERAIKKERAKEDEMTDMVIYDKEGNEIKRIPVRKGDLNRIAGSSNDDIIDKLDKIFGPETPQSKNTKEIERSVRSEYIDGREYQDADGNKAIYRNGKFEPI